MTPDIDYNKDMDIDESALDVEWCNQIALTMKYVKNFNYWSDKVRRLEESKKVCRSILINQANADPKRCTNKDKPNAADIEAFYRADPDYIETVEELLNAEQEKEFAELAYKEMSYTRKAALENLVKLAMANYFAGPEIPRNLTEERQMKIKQVDAGIAKNMKRSK